MTNTAAHPCGLGSPSPPARVWLGDIWCSVCTQNELVTEVDSLVRKPVATPRTVMFLNAHVFCLARADEDLWRRLNNARVVAVDGASISLASWMLNGQRLPRCMMTRAFDAYVASRHVADAPAILAGATGEEAQAAAAEINRLSPHLKVVAAVSGFLPIDQYSRVFCKCKDARLVLVGMGSPKSESVVANVSESCPDAVVWHIGAGTIKCYAGTKKRAPALLHKCGLEWLHRLALEPHTRRRYLVELPMFAWLVARCCMSRKRFAPTSAGSG